MRFLIAPLALAGLLATTALAQQGPARTRLTVNIFRSPATGLELSRGALSIHAGFYPTILRADGELKGRNTNFLRAGVTLATRSSGFSEYITPSVMFSLDDRWKHGLLSEAGVRWIGKGRFSARLGVGVLTTTDGEVRVNPTIGMGVKLGRNS